MMWACVRGGFCFSSDNKAAVYLRRIQTEYQIIDFCVPARSSRAMPSGRPTGTIRADNPNDRLAAISQ